MQNDVYEEIFNAGIQGQAISLELCKSILTSKKLEILPLLNTAFKLRQKYWGNEVTVHILNNVQNGLCSEDCHYCVQSKFSEADIKTYPMKPDEEIMKEAQRAYESGAFRYCMVFSGAGQNSQRIEHLACLVKKIKSVYPLEVCVSPGFITEDHAYILKKAGLDRINHNINTSENFYKKICTTHNFSDRMQTLRSAAKAGLDICSGVIIGMGESIEDVVDVALTLRSLKNVKSIPVNFFLSASGITLTETQTLTPDFCLRVLCLFRVLNPSAEIRMAAGREHHLRGLEALGLFAANSLFIDGYLNVKGQNRLKTLEMIRDAGFTIKSDQDLKTLIENEKFHNNRENEDVSNIKMKSVEDLHPFIKKE